MATGSRLALTGLHVHEVVQDLALLRVEKDRPGVVTAGVGTHQETGEDDLIGEGTEAHLDDHTGAITQHGAGKAIGEQQSDARLAEVELDFARPHAEYTSLKTPHGAGEPYPHPQWNAT